MTEKRHEAVLKPEPARIAGFASIGLSFLAGLGNALRRFEKPSRPAGIPASGRTHRTAGQHEIGNRAQQDGSGMTAIKLTAAVATMAALLTGPVAANQPPGRPRRGFYPWHVFADWLGYRRQVRQESGGTDRRRRNKSR